MPKPSEELTTTQVGRLLHLTPRQVRNLCANGTLPHTRKGLKKILIRRADVTKGKDRPNLGRPKK